MSTARLGPGIWALLLGSIFVPAARADDWPQWRGPGRDGVWGETGILESFPAEGLIVRWRVAVGPGYSGPVVAQRRVYLTDQPRPSVERLLCLEEKTGELLWSHSYQSALDSPDRTEDGRPRSTPTVHAGKLYLLGVAGKFHCFDAATGEVLWKKDLAKEYAAQPPVWGLSGSPLIDGQRVVVCCGGQPDACVVALDRITGKEVWKSLSDQVGYSSPIAITAAGQRQIIVWTEDSVTSLEAAGGKSLWRMPLKTPYAAVATPVVDKQRLLISGLMLELDSDRPAAKAVWPASKAASRRVLSDVSTPLLCGDHVFAARTSGELACLDANTGEKLWETDKVTDIGAGASIHLTVNGDRVFLFTGRGELILARLTASAYEEIGRVAVLEPTTDYRQRKVIWAVPAFANQHLFARNDKELICACLAARP